MTVKVEMFDDEGNRTERVEPVTNPETGEKVYPWMAPDGRPVDRDGYVVEDAEAEDPMNSDPAYLAYLAEQERLCGASYSTEGADPYGTDCRLEKDHEGPHEGANPLGGEGYVRWRGGGSVAGDSLPYRDVEWLAGGLSGPSI